MAQDFRSWLRLIANDLWFSAAIVVAIAFGIGLAATVFTLSEASTSSGAAGFVACAMACANAANLLLSRSIHQRRQRVRHIVMDAARWRIVRRLFLESIALAAVAGILGPGLTETGVTGVNTPYWIASTIDHVVFGCLVAICVVTGFVCGLTPSGRVAFHTEHSTFSIQHSAFD